MAIVDKQTRCLQIITIGYLKNFIGDLIKDSDGNVVHVNPEYTNDSYCPTYSELTGGTLIPNHVQVEESPVDDIDGIVVSSIFYNDGISTYAENQQVNQKDLSLVYTTFNGFSVDASPKEISECGGSSTLSYLYGFTRNTKYMNTDCNIATSAYSISDVQESDVSWSTSEFGDIAYPIFSVDKIGIISANSRTTTVTGKLTFHGEEHTDSVEITQNALTGDYVLKERHYTGVSVFPTTETTFGCSGGEFGIRATGEYYDHYNWVDSCGYEYDTIYKDVVGSEDAGTDSGQFNEIICPSGDTEHPIILSRDLEIEYHGFSDKLTFTLECTGRTDCGDCSEMTASGVSSFDHNAHTSAVIGRYTASQYVNNIHINNGDYPSWLTNISIDTTNKTVIASMDYIPCETVGRYGNVIISFEVNGNDCSVAFNVTQEGNSEICPCTSYEYSATCKVDTDNLVCNNDGSIQLNLTDIPCNEMQAQLSLDVWRKCLAPSPSTDWTKYDDYSVVWSAPSGCFINLFNTSNKVLTIIAQANSTNSSRSCTITATYTVGGQTNTCSATITQQAGPCA